MIASTSTLPTTERTVTVAGATVVNVAVDIMVDEIGLIPIGRRVYPRDRTLSFVSPMVAANIRRIAMNSTKVEGGYFKVGDSNSVITGFMRNFDWQILGETNLVQLGEHPEIEATYKFFAGFHIGFLPCAVSGTRTGYALGIEDASEQPATIIPSPLTLAMGPGAGRYAVIMYGTNQEAHDQFDRNMRAIVEQCITGGVVPILNTIPYCGPCAENPNTPFNDILRIVAEDYQLPLIDGRREYDPLPLFGLVDTIHFNTTGGGVDLTPAGLQFGINRRHLLTLQMLQACVDARYGRDIQNG